MVEAPAKGANPKPPLPASSRKWILVIPLPGRAREVRTGWANLQRRQDPSLDGKDEREGEK